MVNLVLWVNNYWKQQTENNETQKMCFYWLKTVTSSSRFCINITHLNKSETLITVMSRVIFLWRFFAWPRNYYNDNNVAVYLRLEKFAFWAVRTSWKMTVLSFELAIPWCLTVISWCLRALLLLMKALSSCWVNKPPSLMGFTVLITFSAMMLFIRRQAVIR